MNTDLDPENELVQLLVEEAVRAALRTPLREPILAAVEDEPNDTVELVEPEGPGDGPGPDEIDVATDEEAPAVEASETEEKGPVTKAAQGLVVFVAMFAVLYLTLRRLTGDDEE